MKLILQSKQLSCITEPTNDEIHIITQFFKPNDSIRLKEIQFALKQNHNNKHIHHIHLLNEKIYNSKELGLESNKIIQTNIGKRLTFQDVFVYVRNHNINGYVIMINSDICLNHTINRLLRSSMKENKQVCCLLRYEYNKQEPSKSTIFGPRYDSQDTWIFHSKQIILPISEKVFSFEFGKPGCDNKLIYLFSILGYEIINDPKTIQTYHIHASKQRNYSIRDSVKLPIGVIIPYGFQVQDMKQQLGIDLHKYQVWSNNFQNILFDNNKMLFDYITRKFDKNQHFIIPRVSGIENNIAVFSRIIHEKLHHDIDSLRIYIKKTLKAMKNNAGISLTSENSILYYSNLYLSAFDQCEIYASWEPQGEYIKHISQSHSYMLHTYPNKERFWAYNFDIFHYIYNNPWTWALKNKRILLISPFEETLKEQVPNRHLIYDNVDLFPGCEFIYLKPPQTQADEHSSDFSIEFDNFKDSVNEILDHFDVALVSCGGYGNPICGHIYSKGKSAIYVGGVLQMYFGILGNRWIQERNDIIQLFYNDFWKRPKPSEKPKNCNKVENACYW
jgi:hypothetical protein